MIKVGIIDSDKQTREMTKRTLCDNRMNDSTLPIQVLFDTASEDLSSDPKKCTPDVLVVDIQHQESSMLEKVTDAFPNAQIIILTTVTDLKTVRRCFKNGAVSYLLKQTCMQQLRFAVTATVNDGSFISPMINRALLNQALTAKKYEALLTARERHIANGILEGLSYKLVADQYDISLDTVRVYIKRIYRKLNINSKGELIARLAPRI